MATKRSQSILTVVLLGATLAMLALSVPGSLRAALERRNFYLFTADFFEDLPKRLAGPGRFRFILQPLIATVLGIRSGIADARLGRPPYLLGVLFYAESRSELLKSGFKTTLNLLLMGILLDFVAQWLILGASYPGAALVIGPVLIAAPYAAARTVANRFARRRSGGVHSRDSST